MIKQDRKRITLELPASARDKMDELVRRTDAVSVAEIIRRAVILYDLITQYQHDGWKIIVRKDDGNEETLRIL